MASELLGVGYIIGLRTSAVMMAGAVLGGLVLAPALFLDGEKVGVQADDVFKYSLRFIGAGCVAAAGIISMGRTLPLIIRSFASGLRNLRGGRGARPAPSRAFRST